MAQELDRDIDDKFSQIFRNITRVRQGKKTRVISAFLSNLDPSPESSRMFPDRQRPQVSAEVQAQRAGYSRVPASHGKTWREEMITSWTIVCLLVRFKLFTTSTSTQTTSRVFTLETRSKSCPTTFSQRELSPTLTRRLDWTAISTRSKGT